MVYKKLFQIPEIYETIFVDFCKKVFTRSIRKWDTIPNESHQNSNWIFPSETFPFVIDEIFYRSTSSEIEAFYNEDEILVHYQHMSYCINEIIYPSSCSDYCVQSIPSGFVPTKLLQELFCEKRLCIIDKSLL